MIYVLSTTDYQLIKRAYEQNYQHLSPINRIRASKMMSNLIRSLRISSSEEAEILITLLTVPDNTVGDREEICDFHKAEKQDLLLGDEGLDEVNRLIEQLIIISQIYKHESKLRLKEKAERRR